MKKLWMLVKSPGAMAILAIIGFGFAIYQTFVYEKRGQILVSVEPPARVFDVHQPIGGLEVSYAGENLRSSKKALWIVRASIKNSGNAEIKKGDYDEQAPLGLQIDGGHVVDVPTLQTTVSYLQQNLKVRASSQQLLFSPVILEPDDSFQVNLLVLGPENARPTVSAFGKIAGIKSLVVSTADGTHSNESLWERVTGASSWWIHPSRMLVYGLGGLLSFGLLAASFVGITSPFEEIRKRRAAANRRARTSDYQQGEDLTKELRLLLDLFVRDGDSALSAAYRVNECLKKRAELHDRLSATLSEDELKKALPLLAPLEYDDRQLLDELQQKNVVQLAGSKPIISGNVEVELLQLCKYLGFDPAKDGDYLFRMERFQHFQMERTERLMQTLRAGQEIDGTISQKT